MPVEDVAGTVKDLIKARKIKYLGLSEAAPQTIRRAHAMQPVTTVHTEYSLMERIPENGILSKCEELGIGFVPWGLVHRGLLTGWFDANSRFEKPDRRANVPRFTPEALKANVAVVELVRFGHSGRASRPLSSRSPGYSPKGLGSYRFLTPGYSTIWKKTWER